MLGFGKKKREKQENRGSEGIKGAADQFLEIYVASIEAAHAAGEKAELSTLMTCASMLGEHPDLLARVQKVARAQGHAIVRKGNNLLFTPVGSDLDK